MSKRHRQSHKVIKKIVMKKSDIFERLPYAIHHISESCRIRGWAKFTYMQIIHLAFFPCLSPTKKRPLAQVSINISTNYDCINQSFHWWAANAVSQNLLFIIIIYYINIITVLNNVLLLNSTNTSIKKSVSKIRLLSLDLFSLENMYCIYAYTFMNRKIDVLLAFSMF